MATYSLEPVTVPHVHTRYRRIQTQLPVPESLPVFEALKRAEPRSMRGMPPVVWDRAENFSVYDKWGNRWIDWTSCVLVANVGHGRAEIKQALIAQVEQGLLSTYVFAHEKRAALCQALQALAPVPENYTVFLLSTGSEATESCLKLARTYALRNHGPGKNLIVSFQNAFHGRTMGAQLAGGYSRQKEWLGRLDPTFLQAPFPDGFKNEDVSFEGFLRFLEENKVTGEAVAGVITESYQGGGPDFLPVDYAQKLEAFCRAQDIVLICDEVQAGFGRTGKMFCFEHYGIKPDLIACGKGISSSLPLAAVIGRRDILDLYPPGSMSSTHSGSPLCVAAALASLEILQREELVARAARLGDTLLAGLEQLRRRYPGRIGALRGRGLVAGLQAVQPGGRTPDPDTALRINLTCFHKGLLMFAPVGGAGECIKIAPPLTIAEEALAEGIAVLAEAIAEVIGTE